MRHKLLFTALLFLSSFTFSFSQQLGTIRGTIKDAVTKEDLVGATVIIEGQNKGAAADINGFFSLNRVPVGTYTLKVSFVGFNVKVIEKVQVLAEKVTEVNVLLQEEGSTLSEVKVVGQKLTNTEISVISEIKAAQQIVSGISSAQIGKTLDRNAAEVVKRVPGVTIFGDRFINIRGLNERYNSVMLNNTFTPSMETDVRSFSFDIIPSNQIDRILVFKSPAAELPGEFAGGVVKIFTKSIPEQNSITIDFGGGYRDGTTGKNFFSPQHGSSYWTGFNDGYSDLPKFFPANRQELINANPTRLQQIGQSLKNNWTPVQSTALPDLRFTLTGAFKIEKEKYRIGNITAINYSNTRTLYNMARNDYGYSRIQSTGEPDPIFNFQDTQYSNAIRLGVMHNWAVKFGENHTIEFKNLFNQMSNSQFVDRIGFDNGTDWNIRSFDQIYRGIYTGQLVGKHQFNNKNTQVDWVVGYNQSFRDQPDYKRFRYNITNGQRNLLVPQGAAQTFNLGRTNIIMDENAITGGVNLVQKIVLQKGAKAEDNKELELKAGVYAESKERNFKARNLAYVQANSSLFNIGNLPIEEIFAPQNINSTNGVKIDEQTNPNDSYTANNHLYAAYISGNYSLTKKFNVIAGLRVENNAQKLNSFDLVGAPLNYNNTQTTLLPSVNMTYNFSEKALLRLAYGKTINRPEFREVAPFSFYDFVNNRNISGNPQLKNANIHNVDFRYEYYPTPAEVLSIAAFYKYFETPIEVVFASGSNPNLSFDNAKSAYSAGIELEARKSLENISKSPFIQKLNLVFNAAFIHSRVSLNPSTASTQSDNRPLQGQSPYIINAGLNYNDTKKSLQVNLLFNVIGKRIYAVGNNYGFAYPDWYEMPRNVVDLTFSKGIGKNLLIKGGITDILNQTNYILQDGNQDNKFDKNEDQIIQSYKPGSVYSLGVVYTIK
ncbi:TonB-dependent receptor [Flectobacillus sp. DC10W]|uniref:TonB-dependent receptor n=1 Tax=Flectobacillus longus TaxID=2984207 RepID=A0ABT6YH25_9BACT|nr:TonB-dependent receptor [Flectobacillus longus]MDI9862894.1 TonB-dependent receptor [Flectobacillus longus]